MFESLGELADRSLLPEDLEREEAEKRIVKAIGKGLLKTISKMGISTIKSYCGAQIFEAVGTRARADRQVLHGHGVTNRRRGGGRAGHRGPGAPFPRLSADRPGLLPVGGVLQWRRDGELHIWNPDTIASLQHAVRASPGVQPGAGRSAAHV